MFSIISLISHFCEILLSESTKNDAGTIGKKYSPKNLLKSHKFSKRTNQLRKTIVS